MEDRAWLNADSVPRKFVDLGPTVSEKRTNIPLDGLKEITRSRNDVDMASKVLRNMSIFLTGINRFDILAPESTSQQVNALSIIHDEQATYDVLDKMLHEAFGLHFIVDYMHNFGIRISLDAIPENVRIDKSFREKEKNILKQLPSLEQASDGVKQYLSILTALHAGRCKIMLIDEPEMFLHPPLVRRLAAHLSKVISKKKGNLFVSTRSVDFVLGVVQSGVPFTVIRLMYRDGISSAQSVEPAELADLFNRPLARSANMASALFADGAIVAESDNDAAI